MPCYKVKVKWGREVLPEVDANTDEDPMLFKAQIFALTGVAPERQKIMFKGGILKNDMWNLQLKDGATLLLLGSKEQVPEEPVAAVNFIEDMDETELATALELPSGLTNLGNTCYMNATVQCLKSVPQLCEAIQDSGADSNAAGATGISASMTSSLKHVFKQMEEGKPVTPIMLLQTLHRASPQFSQTGENGTYRQQDANECWSEILKMLQQSLPPATKVEGGRQSQYKSFIEQYFGGTFEVKTRCPESPDEETAVTSEQFLQLSCFISQEVKYMHSGLKSKMKEQIIKRSPLLGRDATYERIYLIKRLPAYLTVQFVRFQFKAKEGINAKVLKDIKFPMEFDAFDLCTPELQNKLCPMREKFKEQEDNKVKEPQLSRAEKEQLAANPQKEKDKYIEHPFWFPDDEGSNNSGYYTLQAVLTHKGRSSSSGHYVAWVRHSDDKWFQFDDDLVSCVSSEDILRLSGGGDWHCAYVLLYGPKIYKTPKTASS